MNSDFRWKEWQNKIQLEKKFDRESREKVVKRKKRLGKRMRDIFIAIFSEYLSEEGEFQIL